MQTIRCTASWLRRPRVRETHSSTHMTMISPLETVVLTMHKHARTVLGVSPFTGYMLPANASESVHE